MPDSLPAIPPDGPEPVPTPLAELRSLANISLFAALVGAGAFVHIPFGPMHLSLQTMLVMLTGFVLGPKRAVLAMALYLACGFIGLPMFGRGKAGPAAFLGPTAGYLAGFVAGAAIAGLSTLFGGGRRRVAAMLCFGALGSVVLLLLGAAWLRLTVIDDWGRALVVGFYPFIIGDIIKMAAAAALREAFFRDAL